MIKQNIDLIMSNRLNELESDILHDLEEAYRCLDDLEKNLVNFSKKNRTKRPRIDLDPSQIETRFRNNVKAIRIEWRSILGRIFKKLKDPKEYNSLAIDIITKFSKARQRHSIKAEHYKLSVEALITPIISIIMDDQDINSYARSKQERCKDFILRLIDVRSPSNQRSTQEIRDESPESLESQRTIDVCSVSQTGSRAAMDVSRLHFHASCSNESIYILDALNSAITLHCKVISEPTVDFTEQIYHIINITHIIDVLKKKFSEIRIEIDRDVDLGLARTARTKLCDLVERIDNELTSNLELIDVDHPLNIMRLDLRNLHVQIKLLKPVIMKMRQ